MILRKRLVQAIRMRPATIARRISGQRLSGNFVAANPRGIC